MSTNEQQNNLGGAWMEIPIFTPQHFFTEMEKRYLFSGFNQDGCSREDIADAIESGEHDLFEKDPELDHYFVDAMGLDALPNKWEVLADWYWEDKIESDFRREYELLQD